MGIMIGTSIEFIYLRIKPLTLEVIRWLFILSPVIVGEVMALHFMTFTLKIFKAF
jgi:hypothetical protein